MEKLKRSLEGKYLEACADIRRINQETDCSVGFTVSAMLAMERKKTILEIYGETFDYKALSCLIEAGKAAEGKEGAA